MSRDLDRVVSKQLGPTVFRIIHVDFDWRRRSVETDANVLLFVRILFPSLYNVANALDPLLHGLARDLSEEDLEVGEEPLVLLEVVKVLVYPVLEDVYDSELDGGDVLLAEALQVLRYSELSVTGSGAAQLGIRFGVAREFRFGDSEALYQVFEEFPGCRETPESREERLDKHGVGVHVIRKSLHELNKRGASNEFAASRRPRRRDRLARLGLLLEDDVVLGVLLGEGILVLRRKSQRMLLLLFGSLFCFLSYPSLFF